MATDDTKPTNYVEKLAEDQVAGKIGYADSQITAYDDAITRIENNIEELRQQSLTIANNPNLVPVPEDAHINPLMAIGAGLRAMGGDTGSLDALLAEKSNVRARQQEVVAKNAIIQNEFALAKNRNILDQLRGEERELTAVEGAKAEFIADQRALALGAENEAEQRALDTAQEAFDLEVGALRSGFGNRDQQAVRMYERWHEFKPGLTVESYQSLWGMDADDPNSPTDSRVRDFNALRQNTTRADLDDPATMFHFKAGMVRSGLYGARTMDQISDEEAYAAVKPAKEDSSGSASEITKPPKPLTGQEVQDMEAFGAAATAEFKNTLDRWGPTGQHDLNVEPDVIVRVLDGSATSADIESVLAALRDSKLIDRSTHPRKIAVLGKTNKYTLVQALQTWSEFRRRHEAAISVPATTEAGQIETGAAAAGSAAGSKIVNPRG